MPDSNTVLTALGLDLSQYESSMDKASKVNDRFRGSVAAVDEWVRKIPIVGAAYASTIGALADGFSEARLQGREFARIMGQDVSGSLSETTKQIEDINDALHALKNPSLGKIFAGGLVDIFTSGATNPTGLPGSKQRGEDEEKINALETRRKDLLGQIGDLARLEAMAQSELLAGSKQQSDLLRIEITRRQKIIEAEKEAYKLGGPERAKWSKQVNDALAKQIELQNEIAKGEARGAESRRISFASDLENQRAIAYFQHSGNQRDIANSELINAQIKYAADKNAKASEETLKADVAALEIAKDHVKTTQTDYMYAVHQVELQTMAMALEVDGQTRAANQAKIRLQYENAIVSALAHGNKELAENLSKQQKIAKEAEAIREYKLGAGGRAKEKQEERKQAQIARIVRSQQKSREENERRNAPKPRQDHMLPPTHLAKPGHLIPGGSSLLDVKPKEKQTPDAVAVVGMQEFVTRLFKALEQ